MNPPDPNRDALVVAHLGLVKPIAWKFRNRGLDLDDLIGAGHLGLIHAAETFDTRKGSRFRPHAIYAIREAIRQALTDQSRTIRLPAYIVKLVIRWRALGRRNDPEPSEVAETLGINLDRARLVVDALLRTPSCDPDDLNDLRDREPEPVDRLSEPEGHTTAQQRVDDLLGRLSPRQATVIRLLFGLDGEPEHSRAEVYARLGCVRSTGRLLELQALATLAAAHPESNHRLDSE